MLDASLRAVFLWLAHRRWVAWLALRTPLVRRVALRFVAGVTLDDAVVAVRALNEAGMSATIDHLGESVHDRDMAERAAAAYVAIIERIATERLEANVSLKLTQMGLDLGVDVCCEVVRPVVEAGRAHGVFVRVDMESSHYTDRTLEIVSSLHTAGYDVGAVIQAYLRRSKADVEALAAEGVPVRVCKGAYAEPGTIAYHDRDEVGRSFVELCEALLEADGYPAIATHDPDMIEAMRAFVVERGIPPDRFEFQMLYGIRRDLQAALVRDGYRLRIYVPYGTEWYPYFMRRLAERPANIMFLLRSVLGERR